MALSRTDALEAVERSPEAIGVHDRVAWIGAFTPDGRIEDPVGSQPHSGYTAIGHFYNTFIGPRDITMHRDVDIVTGSTVIRDLDLEIRTAGVTMRIPAYLLYNVENDGTDVKIAELYAFWELPAQVGQLLRSGLRALPVGVQLTRGLLTNQGLIGALGFLSGFRGTGPRGKRKFREFLADARAGDEVAVRRRLAKGARITVGDDAPLSTVDLMTHLAGARPHKLIAAGYSLIVGIDRDGQRGVLIADVAAKSCAITRIRYFSESA